MICEANVGVLERAELLGIERRHRLSGEEFARDYLRKGKPVLISGIASEWSAARDWSPQYFKERAGGLNVLIKEYGHPGGIKTSVWTMGDYANFLAGEEASARPDGDGGPAPYCHDIPIFSLIDSLHEDVESFPTEYLPRWYGAQWWRYVQFFMGPSRSLTPLHFDTLLTHNLFVQVAGRKVFTIFPHEDAKYCARRGWRWFDVDPENPDPHKYPEYGAARPREVLVRPGDMLYLPPGTLHHVRSLDTSISFNIDFHTKRSVVRGLLAGFRGMPSESLYYNFLCALGLLFRVPSDLVFRFYKPYLSYVS